MRFWLLLPVLVAFCGQAGAEDGWVSVGSTQVVAPAKKPSDNTGPSQYQSLPSTSGGIPSSEPVAGALPQLSGTISGDSDSGLVNELLAQVEQLQQEVAMLRGKVEEQAARQQMLEQSQQDRYLDLDRRVSALTTGGYSQTVADTATPTGKTPAKPASEAYRDAMELVRAKKFGEAAAAFDQFTTQYPDDALVANATYWAGEVYLIDNKLDLAAERFSTVTEKFPQHSKAADATYKLGVTLDRQGKKPEARKVLNQVITQYAGKADGTVALARSYLDKMSAVQNTGA